MSRRRWITAAAVVLAAAGAWLLLRPDGARVTLLAIDGQDGHELWSTQLDGFSIAVASLSETGGVAQLAAIREQGACKASPYTLRVNAIDGRLTSKRPTFVDSSFAPPVTDGQVVYRISQVDPDHLALDGSNTAAGAVLWHRTVPYVDNPQIQAGSGVVILQAGRRFTVFDGKTGQLLWRASAKAARVVPGVGVGSIYVATSGGVKARDNRTGTFQWSVEAPRAGDADQSDPPLVASRNGRVAVARGTWLGVYDGIGQLVFTTHFAHPASALFVGQKTIYVGIDAHYVLCDN